MQLLALGLQKGLAAPLADPLAAATRCHRTSAACIVRLTQSPLPPPGSRKTAAAAGARCLCSCARRGAPQEISPHCLDPEPNRHQTGGVTETQVAHLGPFKGLLRHCPDPEEDLRCGARLAVLRLGRLGAQVIAPLSIAASRLPACRAAESGSAVRAAMHRLPGCIGRGLVEHCCKQASYLQEAKAIRVADGSGPVC